MDNGPDFLEAHLDNYLLWWLPNLERTDDSSIAVSHDPWEC
jgi:hypothetical protein